MSHNAEEYDAIAERLFAPIYPVIAAAVVERTGKRCGRMLDVGCGGGHLALAVLREGAFDHVTLLDENADALKMAEDRIRGELTSENRTSTMLSSCCSDICAADLAERIGTTFDLIVSRGSMPFWDDQMAAFKNLYALLAPGGVAYVGGGMGSRALREQIAAQMAEIRRQNGGSGPRMFDMSASKALETSAYEALLEHLGADYDVVVNDEEGRWFVFGKPAE